MNVFYNFVPIGALLLRGLDDQSKWLPDQGRFQAYYIFSVWPYVVLLKMYQSTTDHW